jgi:hypothetical protein
MGFVWRSSAPHHVVSEHKRGKCFALAIALSRRHDLPIYGAKDTNGLIHHAFVIDSGRAVDIRGSVSLDAVARGSRAEGGTIEHVTEADLLQLAEDFRCFGVSCDKYDIRRAYRVIDRYLKRSEERTALGSDVGTV